MRKCTKRRRRNRSYHVIRSTWPKLDLQPQSPSSSHQQSCLSLPDNKYFISPGLSPPNNKQTHHPNISSKATETGVSGSSRSQSFPRMEASDSLSRTLGMDFFIPFPFPNCGNRFSHSRILGMVFFHSLSVPEFREWVFSIAFLFPNFGNGIIHSRSRSRTPKCHSRSPLAQVEH